MMTTSNTSVAPADVRRGFLLGMIAIVIFALGVPMTRLATGTIVAPQLSGAFVACGRAVIAGTLSVVYLAVTRAPWPTAGERWILLAVTGGGVIAFPLAMSLALRLVESIHVSAVIGFAPLVTAVIGARVNRQHPPPTFWFVAVVGSILVVAFPFVKAGTTLDGIGSADLFLLGAILIVSFSTVFGARLATTMPAIRVTCWSCAFALPLTIPSTLLTWPDSAIAPMAWWGVIYVGVGTMWLGGVIWYRALAMGGTVRVSQLLLVQPIIGMLLAVPVLGETIDVITGGFAVAIIATVFVGRRLGART